MPIEAIRLSRQYEKAHWDDKLPYKATLALKVAGLITFAILNLGAVAYGSWRVSQIQEINNTAKQLAVYMPVLVGMVGAVVRFGRNGKDIMMINEKNARQYDPLSTGIMFLAAPFLFPLFYVMNHVDLTNYNNRTLVSTISRQLRNHEFSDITPHYAKRYEKLIQYGFIKDEDGSIRKWMKKAVPQMKQLQKELDNQIAWGGPISEQCGPVLDRTKRIIRKIDKLNLEWTIKMKGRLYSADRQGKEDNENRFERMFLLSKAPELGKYKKFLDQCREQVGR